MKRNKEWFRGLKYAEEMIKEQGSGVGRQICEVYVNTSHPFDRGILDYFHTPAFKLIKDQEITNEADRIN